MKSQLREGPPINVPCKDHKQKCVFVCLHKTCGQSFKVGCPKCRKDHGQHPNRLISLHDFHNMLSKPIRYLQNSTAFKLMNLKKKIQYIRNFRTSILEKEIQLMEENGKIKRTITSILEEHYKIRAVVSNIDTESLLANQTLYAQQLTRCKQFMAFNPVKGDLVFNNQVIKKSRVILERHLKRSHELTDSIRQFLVKIIEVLLANCAHEEDDDDIEFQNEGDNPTNFNIFIKTRTDASENPNIKNKLEHEQFLEMFDEEKYALNQEVDILQKELNFKVNILNKIKGSSQIIQEQNGGDLPESQMELNLQRVESQKLQLNGSQKLRFTQDTATPKENMNSQIIELKEDYQTILANKQDYIQELKEMCSTLQAKIYQLESKYAQNSKEGSSQLQKSQEVVRELEKRNFSLKEKLQELGSKLQKEKDNLSNKQTQLKSLIGKLQKSKELNQKLKFDKEEEISKKESQIKSLRTKIQNIERRAHTKSPDNRRELQKLNKNQQELKKQISKAQQELSKKDAELKKKDGQITKQKKKYAQIQKLVQKMNQNSENSEKELMQWRNQHEQREKMLRDELEYSHKQIDSLHGQATQATAKIRELEAKINQKSESMEQMMQKTEMIVQQQKELADKDAKTKELAKIVGQKDEKIKQLILDINKKEVELQNTDALNKQKQQEYVQKQEKIFRQKEEQLIQLQTKITFERQEELLQSQQRIANEREIEMKQKQSKIQQLQQIVKTKTNKILQLQKDYQEEIRSSKRSESTFRTNEQQNKKIKEMKEMLQISIRKNQQLKDKNYQLQKDMQVIRQEQHHKTNGRRTFCEQISQRNHSHFQEQFQTNKIQTVNSQFLADPPSPTFKKKGIENTVKNKKGFASKEDKRQAYLEIKSIFKVVTQDIGILEDRLKQNTVIEKVYLKELERKRNQNKTLKKQLQNVKLYGLNFKGNDVQRATSPNNKAIDKQNLHSPLNLHPMGENQTGLNKKHNSRGNK